MTDTPTKTLMNRRQFTVQTALAMLSGVAITMFEGCGSSSTPTSPSPGGGGGGGGTQTTDISGTISANHGHEAIITAARLTSPTDIALDIHGTATHTHTVNLTQAQVTSIAARTQVTVTSTTDTGHNHNVTFN